MKHLIRILCFTLVVLTVLGCVSCNNEEKDGEQTEAEYSLSVSDLSKYAIVRSDNAGETVVSAVSNLYNTMSQKFSGIKIKSDLIIEGDAEYCESEYEILVGSTNRSESESIQKQLKKNDYIICLEGSKLIIAGGTDEATVAAIDKFINDFVNSDRSDVFFESKDKVHFKDSYAIGALKLNGRAIEEYSIVYAKTNGMKEQSLALDLQEKIAELTGFVLPVYSDESKDKEGAEILVGKTSRSGITAYSQKPTDDQYCIGYEGDSLYMFGGGYVFAVKALMDLMEGEAVEGADSAIQITNQTCDITDSVDAITSMSFNVYYEIEPNQYNVPDRVNKVKTMILNRMPDTIGFQESGIDWLGILKTELRDYYGCISGKLTAAGQEYCPIFYRKDKFEVVWSECKWLSDTPNVESSKVEGATLPRVVTYARLRRISDGMEFICANTHFDHVSHEVGEKQAQILLNILAEYKDMPVILTGDFNSTPTTKKYTILNSSYLKSSEKVATVINGGPTIHCYGTASEVLDYIFINDSCMYVQKYEVCDEKIDGYYVSDHHPIMSRIFIKD